MHFIEKWKEDPTRLSLIKFPEYQPTPSFTNPVYPVIQSYYTQDTLLLHFDGTKSFSKSINLSTYAQSKKRNKTSCVPCSMKRTKSMKAHIRREISLENLQPERHFSIHIYCTSLVIVHYCRYYTVYEIDFSRSDCISHDSHISLPAHDTACCTSQDGDWSRRRLSPMSMIPLCSFRHGTRSLQVIDLFSWVYDFDHLIAVSYSVVLPQSTICNSGDYILTCNPHCAFSTQRKRVLFLLFPALYCMYRCISRCGEFDRPSLTPKGMFLRPELRRPPSLFRSLIACSLNCVGIRLYCWEWLLWQHSLAP